MKICSNCPTPLSCAANSRCFEKLDPANYVPTGYVPARDEAHCTPICEPCNTENHYRCLDKKAPVVSPEPVGVVIGFTDEGEAVVDHACEGGTPLEIGDCLYLFPPAGRSAG